VDESKKDASWVQAAVSLHYLARHACHAANVTDLVWSLEELVEQTSK
jgi:hypothetical protein